MIYLSSFKTYVLVSLSVMATLVACQGEKKAEKSGAKKGTASSSLTSTLSELAGDANPENAKVDPADVTASFEGNIEFVSSEIVGDKNMKFPQLTIDKKNSDYVMIMRCPESYEVNTLNGQNVRHVKGKSNDSEEFKWAWVNALGDNRSCKLVSEFMTQKVFVDMSAGSGSFYYVINPCISKDRSSTKRNECGYRLALSDSFPFENKLSEKVRDLSIQLTAAQGNLLGAMVELRTLSEQLAEQLTACENRVAADDSTNAFKRGLVMAGIWCAGALIGGGLGGLTMAVMAGQMSMMFGAMMFIIPALKIGAIANSCIGGEDLISQQAAASPEMKDVDVAKKHAKDYEDFFGVQGIINRLQEITRAGEQNQDGTWKNTGGDIQQATIRIQNLLMEMHALDTRIVLLDAAIAKTQQYFKDNKEAMADAGKGLDPNKTAQTIESAPAPAPAGP